MMNIGSNSVENHPVSAKWLHKAHDKGAKWMVVDPRYTRTAEQADIYCPIRSGTDIAFYGGLYKYIIDNLIEPGLAEYTRTGKNPDNYNFKYLINYTNASLHSYGGIRLRSRNGVCSAVGMLKRKLTTLIPGITRPITRSLGIPLNLVRMHGR